MVSIELNTSQVKVVRHCAGACLFCLLNNKKIDRVGPINNRPSTDELHHFVQKKKKKEEEEKL